MGYFIFRLIIKIITIPIIMSRFQKKKSNIMMEMKRRRNDPDSKETNQKKQVKKLHIPQE